MHSEVLILINNEFISVYVHIHTHTHIHQYLLPSSVHWEDPGITINPVVINIPSFYIEPSKYSKELGFFREAVDPSLGCKMDKKN